MSTTTCGADGEKRFRKGVAGIDIGTVGFYIVGVFIVPWGAGTLIFTLRPVEE